MQLVHQRINLPIGQLDPPLECGLLVRHAFSGQPRVQVDACGSLRDQRDYPVVPRDVGGVWIAEARRNTKSAKREGREVIPQS